MEKIEVTGCKDCPLCCIVDESHFCEHPHKKGGTWIRKDMDEETPITPSDCPLWKQSLTISIKQ